MSTSLRTSQVRSGVEPMPFTEQQDLEDPPLTKYGVLETKHPISPWELVIRGLPTVAFFLVTFLMVRMKDLSYNVGLLFLGLLLILFIVSVWAWLPRSQVGP